MRVGGHPGLTPTSGHETVCLSDELAEIRHYGHAPPEATHVFTAATNASCDIGGSVRLPPGAQPHSTSASFSTCSTSWSSVRWPLRAGSLSCSHSWVTVRP